MLVNDTKLSKYNFMPECLMIFHALFTATIEINASYLPHFAALINYTFPEINQKLQHSVFVAHSSKCLGFCGICGFLNKIQDTGYVCLIWHLFGTMMTKIFKHIIA